MSSVTIHASGSYIVKRAPELVDLHLRIHAERPSAPEALQAVRSASAEVSAHIRELAPPKAEVSAAIDSEELDIDDEARDPAFPVTSWSLQQLRTWSETPGEDHNPRPPRPAARMMMAMATEEAKPEKVFHAETTVRATFHDFAKLSAIIETVTVSQACRGMGGVRGAFRECVVRGRCAGRRDRLRGAVPTPPDCRTSTPSDTMCSMLTPGQRACLG